MESKRVLLIRTDRLGDVVLTTPAIKAIRDAYPDAYIAMMVRPYAELAVKGNPYLDEVIVYDKYGKHRSIAATIRFATELRKKGFDTAVIFHPTNRAHIISYLAGIPRRIGYDGRLPFLLTDRIRSTKHEGIKHELDYNLDMLKSLDIEAKDKSLYVPVSDEARKHVDDLLVGSGINPDDRVVAIHPGASCPSKIWPSERFAKLADKLIENYGAKVVVVGGSDKRGTFCADIVRKFMLKEALFLSGKLDISQLAALLKRSVLLISNDSGPVHVAVAVGTPVVSIFGRRQPGLSPLRWGPLGPKDIVLHKDVGCAGICLAHECRREFDCLKAISIDDALTAIRSLGIL
ncbi:MAG: glycosyltransferase family 9 protein [Candidatus Omnitrophica bacterium]|nr:glycosyltransferase family 9 protein [Candidatus Omnitrophota bacterium]